MSLIFGVVGRAGAPVPEGWMEAAHAEARSWPADNVQAEEHPAAILLCRQRYTTPWMRHSAPIARDDQTTLLFDGRIDNREELAHRIGLPSSDGLSDSTLALHAWNRFSDRMPHHITGDFAIAVYQPQVGALTLVRDRIGVRPLFVVETAEFIAFCSAMPPMLAVPLCDWTVNSQWLVDYLEEVKPDAEYTAYREIRAVPPAHVLRLDRDGQRRSRYWSLGDVQRCRELGHSEIVERTRELLDEAVACRLVSAGGRVAAELSGGLDSSSIAVIAADALGASGERLIGVTQACARDFRDRYGTLLETRYADAIYEHRPDIERLDVINHSDSQLARLSETLNRHGAPPRNDFNGFATEAPDLLAQGDARILLSGFGGDQLVTTGAGGLAESLVAEGDWRELVLLLRFSGARKRTLRAMLASLPGIGRWVPKVPDIPRHPLSLASDQVRNAAGYPDRARLHPMPPSNGTLRQRDRIFVNRPVMSYRLQDSQVGAGTRGIEYRYPLLDVRLLEFVHSLPTLSRIKRNEPRRLIRDVMAGRLPPMVHQRRDKFGLTVPGVFVNYVRHADEMRSHLAAMAADARLGRLADYGHILDALEAAMKTGETPKLSSVKAGEPVYRGSTEGQALRLAMVGLWLGRDASTSNPRLG